ncbi:hypothetical protein WI29_29300 [Burkholderia ubonensis]|nr:hypothetical protein WI31_23140 [Burkholderia ubonensis]KUZ11970.1 hypothetical protein WI29_29300 [Burkholderia ubonensis]KUZ39124.1 hypothetical protein WI32_10865 [Burkholderia ubonensis]KUZ45588.1 hypothetical protein WI33_26600 [Burkholderia ubonensis]KUZ60594.1 hypothetical protein WI34_12300 [Burkholderia ubonensis]
MTLLIQNGRGKVVEGADTVRKALRVFVASAKANFADCLIARSGHAAEREHTGVVDVTTSKVAEVRSVILARADNRKVRMRMPQDGHSQFVFMATVVL